MSNEVAEKTKVNLDPVYIGRLTYTKAYTKISTPKGFITLLPPSSFRQTDL